MALLTDKELNDRLSSPDNLINRLTVHENVSRGSGIGAIRVPLEIKKVAAILINQGETGTKVAKGLEIHKDVAYRAGNGMDTGTGRLPVPELKRVIQKVKSDNELNRETAEGNAISLLLTSLNLLPDALARTKKAKIISSVAKDMAAIANQMSNPDDKDGNGERAMHLHLYRPQMKEVDNYEVIDV